MISLHTQKLSKSYNGREVLSDIFLDHSGGILGISGSNGAGKSTLLKCLVGLESISSGQVNWQKNGEELSINDLKKNLGFAAPYIALYRELTILENLEFLAKSKHYGTIHSFDDLLKKVGLSKISNQLFGSLSTGQQQRAKLASALFHNPKVLLFDEPGANLDEQGRTLIEEIIQESKQKNRLIILASNNPDELDLCDEVFSVE